MNRLKKIEKRFAFAGLGIPVELIDAPFVRVAGEWALDVPLRKIEKLAAIHVALKPSRLTGDELRFLRLHLGRSQQEFGDYLDVTRQTVWDWERKGAKASRMPWPAEKDLRLSVLDSHAIPSALYRKIRLRFAAKFAGEHAEPFRIRVRPAPSEKAVIESQLAAAA